jgi:hypothetical protein
MAKGCHEKKAKIKTKNVKRFHRKRTDEQTSQGNTKKSTKGDEAAA